MRAAAKTTRRTHSASVSRAGRRTGGFFKAAGSAGFFGPVLRKASSQPVVQAKLAVSKPTDPLEKDADRTAEKVMRTPTVPAGRTETPLTAQPPEIQRPAGTTPPMLRLGEGTPTVAADARTEIRQATTGGQALTPEVRGFMEPRLGADLSQVRVHADETAHSLSNHLSARAFTYRDHIFFGRNQYQPGTDAGRHLLAHELTHTIQQGATVQRSPGQQAQSPAAEERPRVVASTSPPAVQRLGVQDALDYFADKANNIPGFRMLTLVLGFNPVNMRRTDRTAANFLRALIEMVPGGALITRALDNHGVINKAADWVEQRIATLGDIGAEILAGLKRFIDSLGWSDILDLGGVWDRAKRIFTDPIGRLISFGTGVVGDLLNLVKQAVLRPLAALAQGTAGYDLLKAILGQDPITGDPVPRTPDTLIGGFMKLIGQEEVWLNIKRGNAVARAFAWFQGVLAGLMGFVRSVPQRIVQTITSLTFQDVITVVGAFQKVGSAFLGMAAQFGAWALNQVLGLLEILVSVVAPGVMPYIAKAKAAFHTIIRDPVRFIGNLVRAGKLGFQKFAGNIVNHLKTALIKWITGPLGEAGVYIPTSFSLIEIVKLVLSVLGLTWQNIRTKLLKIIPEPILAGAGEDRLGPRHAGHPGPRRRLGGDQGRADRAQGPADRADHPDDLVRGRQGGRDEAREHAQPGGRGDPSDHRRLQHGDVLHREGASDRRRRRLVHRFDRRHRRGPGRVRGQPGRDDARQHADGRDLLPRPVRRSRWRPRQAGRHRQEDPAADRPRARQDRRMAGEDARQAGRQGEGHGEEAGRLVAQEDTDQRRRQAAHPDLPRRASLGQARHPVRSHRPGGLHDANGQAGRGQGPGQCMPRSPRLEAT